MLDRIKHNQMVMQAAKPWIGTPFHANASVKGAGVDCVCLAAAIYRELGILEDFRPPPYRLDAGANLPQSMVHEYLAKTGRFQSLELPAEIQAGDLLCFRVKSTHVDHHVGLAVSSRQFVHAAEKAGVVLSDMQDSFYRRRLSAVFRPIAWLTVDQVAPVQSPATSPCLTCGKK